MTLALSKIISLNVIIAREQSSLRHHKSCWARPPTTQKRKHPALRHLRGQWCRPAWWVQHQEEIQIVLPAQKQARLKVQRHVHPSHPYQKSCKTLFSQATTEERFVEHRRRFLHYFCQKIAEKPFLFDSDIFQTFIRGDPDFQRVTIWLSRQSDISRLTSMLL